MAALQIQDAGEKRLVHGEENTGCKGRAGPFQIKQHPTGFIGSTGDNIFITELAA